MKKKLQRKINISSIIEFIENQFVMIGGIATFLMMLLVVADVLGRQLFNSSIKGQMEIIELLMVIAVFLGIAYTQRDKEHVGMDIIHTRLKGISKKIVNASTLLLSLFVYIVITFSLFKQTIAMYNRGIVSIYLQWPFWILNMFIFIGCLLLCFRLLLDIKSVFYSNTIEDAEEGGAS